MKPLTTTFNRTLMVESSSVAGGEPGSSEDVMEYFKTIYPEFELIKMTWVMNSKYLQVLFTELDLIENVLEILEAAQEDDTDLSWWNRQAGDLDFYTDEKIKLCWKILEEKKVMLKKTS